MKVKKTERTGKMELDEQPFGTEIWVQKSKSRNKNRKEKRTMKYTLDELVARVQPNYVSVNNPQTEGKTPGSAIVASFHVDCDSADGLMMYVTLEEDPITKIANAFREAEIKVIEAKQKLESKNEPVTQYEIWPAGDDHTGYPLMLTQDSEVAAEYEEKGYDIRSYKAYPVI